ncbi:MAG TPA: hypothetical protein VI603_15315 [Saprospiraceae bacterium]|nr:hypothetical protein [Saprospiraceae bacterium]
MYYPSHHTFHIPVMGLAYTIDTPIKVARFGISSVISIVEDRLIEMMRSHYYPSINQEYRPITTHEPDYRAKRITDYLNLVNTIVQEQVEKLQNAAFEAGSEIVKYFEMLPDQSSIKHVYRQMLHCHDQPVKIKLATFLRSQIAPGSIDVNIMTKIDKENSDKYGKELADSSDAVAALRGYARSNLTNSSVVFSAGMNPRLYSYLELCKEFEANGGGNFTKKIIIKVSDYRSALIQGKYLAKKGLWVSEFRIESGLNCGGHAFATEGYLLGPILEEFKSKKQELFDTLFEIYTAALWKKSNRKVTDLPNMILTVQGGIGTHEEDAFLHRYYNIESTGWGTPFLLVPQATTVDDETVKLLCAAKETDVVLSRNSPLGIRFHYLKGTSAEHEKLQRISNGKPGSPCTEKFLAFDTEFTKEPICTASHKYQKLKISQLQSLNLPEPEYKRQLQDVLSKECLCVGLSNSAAISYTHTFIKKLNAVTICPGPNIANFSRVVSLQTMTDHIYGRTNIMTNPHRPHMFIAELNLYIDYLKEQLREDVTPEQFSKKKKYYVNFYHNLQDGIAYYRRLPGISDTLQNQFFRDLDSAESALHILNNQYVMNDTSK